MPWSYEGFGREFKCPVCKKSFFVTEADMWCYKIYDITKKRYRLACSWKCLRKYERENNIK